MISKLLRRLFNPRAALRRTGKPSACPICDAGIAPVLFESTRAPRVLICPACRHLFWDSTPTAEELTAFYESEYCESHDQPNIQQKIRAYYRGHVENLLRMVDRPRAAVCLVDYGSSIPTLVHEARDAGVGRPIAVDLDRKAWEYAQAHGLDILTPTQYMEQLPAESVDILRFSHVLEHLIDPVAAVAAAVRKLRPGGLLYITQPNFPILKPQHSNYRLKDSVYPSHLHFFSPLSLLKMVSRFPLTIEKLFTNERPEEVFAELSGCIDLDFARKKLAAQAMTGEPPRGEKANYPFYTGENSELIARKVAA